MNIINYITSMVSSKIDYNLDTFNAITEAIKLTTSSYSPEEASAIKEFASKLRHKSIPELKGIVDHELSSAVWDICCWAIEIKHLSNRIMEMVSLYTDTCLYRISLNYNKDGQYVINLHNDYDVIIKTCSLTHYIGIELIEEIIEFIKKSS